MSETPGAAERERQRFEHLVLGRDRPVIIKTVGVGRKGRRKPVTTITPVELAPGIEEQVALRERWSYKQGTAQTHEKNANRQQGALARLCQSGGIDHHQLAAGEEIATIAYEIRANVSIGIASLEARVDTTRRGDGTFFESLGRVRGEMAYTRWRGQVVGPLGAILAMIVGDDDDNGAEGFTIVARRYGMHNRRAKKLLIDALDLWPKIRGKVTREVDAASLLAAQAGILA
ncbi:hypothetical protein BH10PSE14_BH10PSE14_04530 [soil metagenome]